MTGEKTLADKLLVCLDGSRGSEAGLGYALAVARATQADLPSRSGSRIFARDTS